MEHITIINKSGKVVSTGKHLFGIFKDAKDAYNEKKAELKAERQKLLKYKQEQKLIQAREETQSNASRHSHRSRTSSRHSHSHSHSKDKTVVSRPPLTVRNLTEIPEGSVTSSRRSRSSHHGSRRARSPRAHSPRSHRGSSFEDQDKSVVAPNPGMVRRHTDFPSPAPSHSPSFRTLPPPALHRSISNPDFSDNIDMNLAYGELHHPLEEEEETTEEVEATMTKLEVLLTEAHCLQHTATAIISNLQSNPEAMAAVALTLAELSSLLTKLSPSLLTGLKAASPAIFALLASPQFLIAGGLAIGVTVVMFGGFKIIKNMQTANIEAKKEANRMEEAMVYDGLEMGSIESWRRGIADVENRSVSTSVDGEFITPEAARQKKERIRERAREERNHEFERPTSSREERKSTKAKSVVSERTVRRVGSDITIRQKDIPIRSSSSRVMTAPSESGRSRKESEGKEIVVREKEKKKKSALSVLFKMNREKNRERERESSERHSHRPKMIEMGS